ncbi:MAG: penicillin-binding protein 2 [Pseudomonadota bacterium]|nr:penicillin-binding protein 2 [Pseudomonadota bacterium]MEC9392781.1 penicillin-binding protein 2 [Pseudomonadota bacterium]MEC9459035.1 penicillin-binding protein 2 [Pseudomonadota bacterium]MEC9481182.1 penicillin-binding protein 2 [Pseudomonadota bacterium]
MVNDIKIKNRIVAGDDISYLYKQEKSVSNNSLKDKNPNLVGKERLKIALVFFVVFFSIFSVRNTFLSIFPGEVISQPGNSIALSESKPLPDIYDRSGKNLLATTVRTVRAAVVKRSSEKEFDIHKAAIKLSPYLKQDPEVISKRLSKGRYIELVNDISEKEQYELLNSGVAEVEFNNVWRRVFPNKNLASHILGFSNRDFEENSSAGFERWIYKNDIKSERINLSLNINVQNHLEKKLFEAIDKFDAKAGFGIILNANNGEIVALASLPDYDPNKINYYSPANTKEKRFNRAIQGSYEMGSVMKIFTLAMALEEEKIALSDEFDVWKCIDKSRKGCLSDYKKSKVQFLNAAECLIKSSNICMVQIARITGLNTQKRFLSETGILDEQFLELYEMGKPSLPIRWDDLSMEQISFGQGISVVPLSFASAAASIVNGGYLIEPTIYLSENKNKNNTKLISSEVSETMRYVMRQVVKFGSGKKADVEGYEVIGKTGTADKPCSTGGYCGRLTSFVGAFPGWRPEYIILISLDEPQGKKGIRGSSSYWNAAPTAGEIIRLSAPLLNIAKKNESEKFYQNHARAQIQ